MAKSSRFKAHQIGDLLDFQIQGEILRDILPRVQLGIEISLITPNQLTLVILFLFLLIILHLRT